MNRRQEIRAVLRAFLVIAACCTIAILAWRGLTYAPALDDRGGVGQQCYPNDTCRGGLTCYEIRERHQCEREIKPVFEEGVWDGGEGEQQRCFNTSNECLVSFARIAGDREIRVVRGCSQQHAISGALTRVLVFSAPHAAQ